MATPPVGTCSASLSYYPFMDRLSFFLFFLLEMSDYYPYQKNIFFFLNNIVILRYKELDNGAYEIRNIYGRTEQIGFFV